MTPTTDERPPTGDAPQPQQSVQVTNRATLEIIKILAAQPAQKEMLQQLVDAETARDLFDQDYRAARIYALSGQFDDIKGFTPEQAIATCMAKIRIGRSWGMLESDAIASVYWINGKPHVATEILAQKIQQAGYGWDIDWAWEEITHKGRKHKRCIGCTLWLKAYNSRTGSWDPVVDRNDEPVNAWFTEADADLAIYYEKGKPTPLSEKWNFKSWPQDMYFWRALSRLRKYHLTAIMHGAQQYELRNETYVEPLPAQLPSAEAAAEPEAEQPEEKRRPLRDIVIETAEQESLLPKREMGDGE